jgi:hypothetical protein
MEIEWVSVVMSDQITNTIKMMAGFTPFGMRLIFG